MTSGYELSAVLSVLESVLPGKRPLPLHQPLFQGSEWTYVKDCLDTGWVSSVGDYVNRFERSLSEYTGIRYVTATVNGTAALHTALLVANIERADEVMVPALTFVATANAVSYCGATPHFVEINPRTLGVDPDKLEAYLDEIVEPRGDFSINRLTGKRLRALVVVHAFGHACELDRLQRVCERFNLLLVEDAAEALGTFYRNRHVGTWGRLSILSFNGNKVLTTGGGGAVLTQDPALAQRAHDLTTTAKQEHPWAFKHCEIGFNYRMPNINAALGCAQLEQLPLYLERKRDLAERYQSTFSGVEGVSVISEPPNCRSNYWLNNLLLEPEIEDQRDALLNACHERGILVRPAWELMQRLPMYRHCPRMDLSETEALGRRLVSLPSGLWPLSVDE